MVKPNQVSGAKAKKKTNDYSKNVVDQQKVDLMCVPFIDYFKRILYYVDRRPPWRKKQQTGETMSPYVGGGGRGGSHCHVTFCRFMGWSLKVDNVFYRRPPLSQYFWFHSGGVGGDFFH